MSDLYLNFEHPTFCSAKGLLLKYGCCKYAVYWCVDVVFMVHPEFGVILYFKITNCRRLWRPRHSLSKQAVHIINNKNVLTNCTGYGGDAIASYYLLYQLTYKIELIILPLQIPDEPFLFLNILCLGQHQIEHYAYYSGESDA